MASDDLFTREEALAGLPAQRAKTLLFLIESRTAHLVARSRHAMQRFITEEAAEERDLAFLEAFALGKDPPLRPTIQDLERFAGQWVDLVPGVAGARAALAHLLGQKYAFTRSAAAGIRQALGLDEEAVQRAYQRQYRQPLESIYTARIGPFERLRWGWNRLATWLESLPPFWTAFSLTLTETVGASILALPIALAGVGPLPALVLLVAFGLVNVLTIIYVAETLSRTGSIRYGNAYFGRLVADYLGRSGSFVFSLALALLIFLVLMAYYIGFSTSLADATRLPAGLWAGVLFLVGLYFLKRESLNATISSALVIGATNILLILAISLLAFTRLRPENLAYIQVPFVAGQPFDASILQLVFGIALTAYFGHTSIANGAKVVLSRDPSGRSLVWGGAAAQIAAILLYSVWILAVSGVISATELTNQTGTVLVPLAAELGPVVRLLGLLFAVLALGMASIHFTIAASKMVVERLPSRRRPVLLLPRQRGRLVFRLPGQPTAAPLISLVYSGLAGGRPRFILEVQDGSRVQRLEVTTGERWEASAVFEKFPGLRQPGVYLKLETLQVKPESVRLQVITPLAVSYAAEPGSNGLELSDLLALPEDQRRLLQWLLRRGQAGLGDIQAHMGFTERETRQMLQTLSGLGYVSLVDTDGELRCQPRIAPQKGSRLPQQIWQALDEPVNSATEPAASQAEPGTFIGSVWKGELGDRSRFLLGVIPVFFIFLLVEWLMFTQAESFTEPLNFAGVIIISLLGAIFPVLLLLASQRKGDFIAGTASRTLSHPLLMAGIYILGLTNLVLHGLVIWQNPFQRGIALATAVLILAATLRMFRSGSFVQRSVLELRLDQSKDGRVFFNSVTNGQPLAVKVELGYTYGEQSLHTASAEIPDFPALCQAHFQLPVEKAKELKVWAHRITAEGESQSLPVHLEVHSGDDHQQFDLEVTNGQALVVLDSKQPDLSVKLVIKRDSTNEPDSTGS